MNERPLSRIVLTAAVLALSAGLAFAEPAPRDNDQPTPPRGERGDRGDAPRPGGDRGDAPRPGGERGERGGERGRDRTPPKTEELSGTVESYNLSPRGVPDGLLIKTDGKTVQVNCPPEIGMALSRVAPEGDKVKLDVIPERGAHENSVYFLVKLTSSKGEELGMGAAQPATVHVDGVVKHLNHGRAGEVNGAILETGDFVFVGPESAEQLKLEVGTKLSIDGTEHPMPQGHKVIRATKVNGVSIVMQIEEGRGRFPREGGNGDRPPRGERRPDGPPGAGGQRNPPDGPPGTGGQRNPPDGPPGPGGQRTRPDGPPGPGGQRNPADKPPGPGGERNAPDGPPPPPGPRQ